jgi:hypothetical protein
MAHNFKLTGNIYVSKEGNDSNDGTSPDAPKLTVQAGLSALGSNQRLVVGAGVYSGTITKSVNGSFTYFIEGDGEVLFDGDNLYSFVLATTGNSQTAGLVLNNIVVRDYVSFEVNGGGVGGTATNPIVMTITNCLLDNVNFNNSTPGSGGTTNITYSYCKFLNCSFNSSIATTTRTVRIKNSLLSNCSIISTQYNALIDSYFNNMTSVTVASTITTNNFNFNNIQGAIIMNVASVVTTNTLLQDTVGNYYNPSIASGGSGTSGDPWGRAETNGAGFYFAEHRILYPTFNTRSFSADPLFNDAPNLNFTLQASSPHIKAASDYVSNIGGTEYAVYIAATDDELDLDATVTDLTLAGDAYTITSPATEGSVISAPIFLQWPIVKPLTKIEYTGGLEFNKSITPPAAGNNNVPAYDTYTTGAGANPDRLSIRMRYSTQQTEPATSGEWDNGGYWPAGEWRVFEINTKPKIDVNGIGNGSPTYIESSSLGDLTPSWIQTEIVLRDDYLP